MTVYAKLPTPLFNQIDLPSIFSSPMPLDAKGHLRSLETVLLPGSEVRVIDELAGFVVSVATPHYTGGPWFTDRRFLAPTLPHKREVGPLPTPQEILDRLLSCLGLPYLWGGSFPFSVPEMAALYPLPPRLSHQEARVWTLTGIDCSGLLYYATRGALPRNTSGQVLLGTPLAWDGATPHSVEPLDLFFTKGHVVIALSPEECIESIEGRGVIITPLQERLASLLATRTPTSSREEYEEKPGRCMAIRWL